MIFLLWELIVELVRRFAMRMLKRSRKTPIND